MNDISLSEVLHGNWMLNEHSGEVEVHPIAEEIEVPQKHDVDQNREENFNTEENEESPKELDNLNEKMETEQTSSDSCGPSEKVFLSSNYEQETSNFQSTHLMDPHSPQLFYYANYGHNYQMSSTYHQPFLPMVRNKKTNAIATALQRPVQIVPASTVPISYYPGIPLGYTNARQDNINGSSHGDELNQNSGHNIRRDRFNQDDSSNCDVKASSYESSQCGDIGTFLPNHQKGCYQFPIDEIVAERNPENNEKQNEQQNVISKRVPKSRDEDEFSGCITIDDKAVKLKEHNRTRLLDEDNGDEIIVVDEETETSHSVENETVEIEATTEAKQPKSQLEALLMQPVKKPIIQDYQSPFIAAFSPFGNQLQQTSQPSQSSKAMQFYQPPAQQHLARNTPPPGFAQPYGMGMRPHEEETRQIMNLDNQQTHNSSPTSSWNQPYGQMTNLNAYQQRGPSLYAQPVPPTMIHQNGPPGVVSSANPYYPTTGPPPSHHHMQPQAPMMPPGMHGQQQQQQQPYYNTQSPLTGTPPMNYGSSQMPAPPTTNGSTPIFNFSKPRNSNESASSSGSVHRRKKQNDLSSPRYNSNNNEEVDASVFPDMSDFPLLDVVQSKAKKDAGRKPCRPHLCEQSRMLISRVCHFQREFIKRLPARHPLANSPFSKPDQWTSQIMGISLATVRKCVDMAVDEEVFTRCTDKNLVNLTPSERAEREAMLSKLSTVFEGEKSLGAGTAGMTIAEYSPRRSYSNTLLRQSTDEKSSNSSFTMNGAEYASSETTLLNLDDHSNGSKDFGTTPTPTAEMSNGSHAFEEVGSSGAAMTETDDKLTDLPKRGRPRKAGGATKSNKRKQSNEGSDTAEDKDEHEKKTEDEDETAEETEKKTDELQQEVLIEREDDAASSEGTNRSETATPEPAATTAVAKKTRAATRRKINKIADEDFVAATKKKRGSITTGTSGIQIDDENSDHKMVTRARSRQP